jgi:hypothetical protein
MFSVLVVLTIICCGEVLFLSSLFGVLEVPCTWMGNSFLRFRKFSALILLNILYIPLASISFPSSMPMIHRFGLLMELLSSCIFLLQFLSLLSKSSVFSLISILYLSSEILSSTFPSLLEWLSTVFIDWEIFLSSLAIFIIVLLESGTGYSFSSFSTKSSTYLLFFWGIEFLCLLLFPMFLISAVLLCYWLASWQF